MQHSRNKIYLLQINLVYSLCMVKNIKWSRSRKNKTVTLTRKSIDFLILCSTGTFTHKKSERSATKNMFIIQGLIKTSHSIFGRACQLCSLWIQNSLIQIYSHKEFHWEMYLYLLMRTIFVGVNTGCGLK